MQLHVVDLGARLRASPFFNQSNYTICMEALEPTGESLVSGLFSPWSVGFRAAAGVGGLMNLDEGISRAAEWYRQRDLSRPPMSCAGLGLMNAITPVVTASATRRLT